MVDCSSYQCERIVLYLCTPFHYVIYVAQLRSDSKEGVYILAYPFHLQQTINKPKGLQQQEASITHPSCGSSHLAQDLESTSGAALCHSGLSSSPPEGVSTWMWLEAGLSSQLYKNVIKDGPSAIIFPVEISP